MLSLCTCDFIPEGPFRSNQQHVQQMCHLSLLLVIKLWPKSVDKKIDITPESLLLHFWHMFGSLKIHLSMQVFETRYNKQKVINKGCCIAHILGTVFHEGYRFKVHLHWFHLYPSLSYSLWQWFCNISSLLNCSSFNKEESISSLMSTQLGHPSCPMLGTSISTWTTQAKNTYTRGIVLRLLWAICLHGKPQGLKKKKLHAGSAEKFCHINRNMEGTVTAQPC